MKFIRKTNFSKTSLNLFVNYLNSQSELIIDLLDKNGMKFINTKISSFNSLLDAYGNIRKDLSENEIKTFIKSSLNILNLLCEYVSITTIKRFYTFIKEREDKKLSKENMKLYKDTVLASARDFIVRYIRTESIAVVLNTIDDDDTVYEFTYIENEFFNKFQNNVLNMFCHFINNNKCVTKQYKKIFKTTMNYYNKSYKIMNKFFIKGFKKSRKKLKYYNFTLDVYSKITKEDIYPQLRAKSLEFIKTRVLAALETLNGKEVTNLLLKFDRSNYVDNMMDAEAKMIKSSGLLFDHVLFELIKLSAIDKAHNRSSL